jgi:hypothetical protein
MARILGLLNRMQRLGVVAKVVVVICVSSGATACSTDEASDLSSLQTLADQALLGKPEWIALEEKVTRCMREEGFSYFPVPFVEPSDVEKYLTIPMSRKQLDTRRTTGYGVSERQRVIVETQSDVGNNPYIKTLSPTEQVRYTEALSGDRRSGKPGKCTKPLSSNGLTRLERPLKVAQEAKKRFTSNKSVREIGLEWKQCMSREGFTNFGMPWEINLGEIVDVMGSGYERALSDELAVARADVGCLSPRFDELNQIRQKSELEAEQVIPT